MERYQVEFKKRFGQNFLKNDTIVEKIVSVVDLTSSDLVIEVGPGGAIMTRELAMRAKQVLAYEIDADLSLELEKRLQGISNVKILFEDFLKSDIRADIQCYQYQHLYFVSNVPYYITTPILLKLIESKLSFDKIVMMVQKEVGERFSTACGNKNYGSITVLLNYHYDIKKEFLVSRSQFVPKPNVDSVVVSFTEKKARLPLKDYSFFERLVRDSFQFKRKTIRNNLRHYDLEKIQMVLEKYHYTLDVRAEMLDYTVFVDLANALI